MANNPDDTIPITPPVVILDFAEDDAVGDGAAEFEGLTEPSLDVVEDGRDVSYERLYAFLLEKTDVIITIDAEDEEPLRRGMTLAKYSHNEKLKKAKASADNRQIEYRIIERLLEAEPPQIRLQIWLKAKKAVKIHRLIITSNAKDF